MAKIYIKRVLIVLASIVVMLGTFLVLKPKSAQADGYGDDYIGEAAPGMLGQGTQAHPYQISTCEDFQNIDHVLNNGGMQANFKVMNDIDCSETASWNGGSGFSVIGSNASSLNGVLDGGGHTVSGIYMNLSGDADNYDNYGIFNTLGGDGRIDDLSIDQAVIVINLSSATQDNSQHKIGGLVGDSYGTLSNVHFSGDITQGATNCLGSSIYIGGLAGSAGSVRYSSASGSVSVLSAPSCMNSSYKIGGLAGQAYDISSSYANVAISLDQQDIDGCTWQACRSIGGLAGQANNVSTSYAGGSIDLSGITGLIGERDRNSVGGLVGYMSNNYSSVSYSFNTTLFAPIAGCSSNDCVDGSWRTGGIYGADNFSVSEADSRISSIGNYYDQATSNITQCNSEPYANCTAVNADGLDNDHFANNHSVSPLDNWDFDTVWATTSNLPVHQYQSAKPGKPTNVQVVTTGTDSLEVSWDAPVETGGAEIDGYEISYRKVNDTIWHSYNVDSPDTTTIDLGAGNLEPATQYEITVSAISRDNKISQPSDQVVGITATPGTYLISDCQQLQNITDDLAGSYELAKDIDCSETIDWNNGAGFIPIGYTADDVEPFSGTLRGNNHTINNLYLETGDSYQMVGLFATTFGASVQDLKFSSPVISLGRGSVGLISAQSVSTNIVNVQVYNGTIVRNGRGDFAGGLFGAFAGGTLSHSSYQGSIYGFNSVVGGLVGYAFAGQLNQYFYNTLLTNNYSDVSIVQAPGLIDTEMVGAGGMVGFFAASPSSAQIENSYASGVIDYSGSENNMIVGGVLAAGFNVDLVNSFSHMHINSNPNVVSYVGGVVGGTVLFGPDLLVNTSGVYAQSNLAEPNQCSGDQITTCNPVSSSLTNYFYNNTTNPPLDSWDFDSIWGTTSTLPVFKTTTTPSAVPTPIDISGQEFPGRLKLPALFGSNESTNNGGGSGGGVEASSNRIANTSSSQTPSGNPLSQALTAFKEFVKSLPPGVVVAFPYALLGLLGIGVIVLLLELGYEVRRTHLLEVLLRKQQLLAEERDAFWHLAANYLRAPVTLIVGGAESLRESQNSQSSVAIGALAGNLQKKVAQIMAKIEGSTSLQQIKHAHVSPVIKTARKAAFIVPLTVVALLVFIANYAASSYRNMSPGFVGYASQLVIFVIVALALYWALGLVTRGKSKRRAAQELLNVQTAELANARHELISDTANILNPDLAKLEGQLAVFPAASATTAVGAIATLREGTSRLRQIISSFSLLIQVQEGTGVAQSSPSAIDLTGMLGRVRAKLTPQISKKHIRVAAPTIPLAVSAQSEMAQQVIESILANAVDYSPEGGTVTVEARQLHDAVQLRISDQGQGIDKQQLDHLFQPFVRTDGKSAMDMSHGGFGINLYLDKLIMEQLGGSISVNSTPGKGTAFTMTWPTA